MPSIMPFRSSAEGRVPAGGTGGRSGGVSGTSGGGMRVMPRFIRIVDCLSSLWDRSVTCACKTSTSVGSGGAGV